MSHIAHINRRVFLKGAGTFLALPFLESLGAGKTPNQSHPTRFCFLYVPNGMSMAHWRPRQVGPLTVDSLSPILAPLAGHLPYVTVASGLDNRASEKTGRPETLGQHARSIAAFLPAVYPARELRAGESIDVVLARNLGAGSRIPILNLATEYAEDQHDVGYSEVFNYSLSWKDEHTPIQPIESPRYAFELLCGDARTPADMKGAIQERNRARKSVLDAVVDAGKSLRSQLNPDDRRGLEEYLESVRSVETTLDQATPDRTPAACLTSAGQFDDPPTFDARVTVMLDLLWLAISSNSVPVTTLLLGAERSERDFGFLSNRVGFDMSGGYHSTSHHQRKPERIRRYVQISTYYTRHLARFMQKLRETREGDANLLDRTLIVYGSSMSDGNSHEHYDLPLLIAGKGNGLIDPGKQGFHIDYGGKPVSNLFLTLLQKMSITDTQGGMYTSFGDSGGTLDLPGGR